MNGTAKKPRRILFALITMLGVSVAACDDGKLPIFDVSGKVETSDGQPAGGALLTFYPVDKTGPRANLWPRAKALSDGTFTLTTYSGSAGVPLGDYDVSVIWPDIDEEELKERANPDDAEGPDLLNGKYEDPKTSGLRVTVKKTEGGDIDLPTIVVEYTPKKSEDEVSEE